MNSHGTRSRERLQRLAKPSQSADKLIDQRLDGRLVNVLDLQGKMLGVQRSTGMSGPARGQMQKQQIQPVFDL